MRLTLVLIAATVSLGSCTQVGRKFDPQSYAVVEPHKTTCAEVLQRNGEPYAMRPQPDGTKVLSYQYAEGRPNAASYIPYVGLFFGSTSVDARAWEFQCDRDG